MNRERRRKIIYDARGYASRVLSSTMDTAETYPEDYGLVSDEEILLFEREILRIAKQIAKS